MYFSLIPVTKRNLIYTHFRNGKSTAVILVFGSCINVSLLLSISCCLRFMSLCDDDKMHFD